MSQGSVLVLDTGSWYTRAGLAADEKPLVTTVSLCGATGTPAGAAADATPDIAEIVRHGLIVDEQCYRSS